MAAKKKGKKKKVNKTGRYRAALKRKQTKRRERVSRQKRVKSGPRNPTRKK